MAGRFADDDFAFGEIPDDDADISNGAGDESEIDANNDETFGGAVNLESSDELEDYAAQTAGLRLDDVWDTPSCSLAPDPSELPLPSFDFSNFGCTSFDLLGNDSFNIWNPPSNASGGWPKAEPTERIPSPHGLRQDAPSVGVIGSPGAAGVIGASIGSKPIIPPMPKAPTLEELESSHVRRSPPPHMAKVPAVPAAALSAEELERKMIEEAQMKQKPTETQHQNATGNPSSVPPLLPPVGAPTGFLPPGSAPILPPIPPIFIPCFPVWLDLMTGRIPYLPPGYPPVPAFVVHLMKQFQDPRLVLALLTTAVSPALPPMPMPGMVPPLSQTPQNHSYHRKPPGMPSGKTIEDLAFDQFAGFMSRKERQWLVKIQILQCQGTNNPYEDDYYYQCWRQKRLAEGVKSAINYSQKSETKEILNGQRNRRRERNGSVSEPKDRETTLATKFAGSLGIPSKSTTSNPRHLIRVEAADSVDDENDKKMASSQKKLRTLLLRLETDTFLLIECADRHVMLQSGGQNREQLFREISERVSIVIADLFGDDFAKLVQVAKGRALIKRLLKVALPPDMCRIIAALVSQGRSAHGKVISELAEDVLPAIYTTLLSFGREHVLKIVCFLGLMDIIQGLNEKNMFIRDLLYTILLVCSMKKVSPNCQFFVWLRSTNAIDLNNEWPSKEINLCDILPVTEEDVMTLAAWLHLLVSESSHGTVASQIAARLNQH